MRQDGVVVVDVPQAAALITRLVERGITAMTARTLARLVPVATIAHRVEVFDWLREADPHDARLTPGRGVLFDGTGEQIPIQAPLCR